ncbi:cystatin-11-like [Eleutherodactylus coqui]|uniref:cystatin-11-like n=1 Tax=Eleutherodactylus coqui TaxID=57060 RepID=UPI00346342B9
MPSRGKIVLNLVKFIEKSYNEESQSLYWSTVTKVEKPSIQVTNGIEYQITVVMESTGCLKEDLKNCKTLSVDEMKVETCHYYIKEQLPDFKLHIIDKACEQM